MSLVCAQGVCVSTCDAGYANCATPAAPAADNGCEQNVQNDSDNCGACGNACTAQGDVANGETLICGAGAQPKGHCGCPNAKACSIGDAEASCTAGRCVCEGQLCSEGEACVDAGAGSVCSCNGGAGCGTGKACCDSPMGCMDLTSDPANCGGCGRACPPGFICNGAGCACMGDDSCNAGTSGTFSCNGSKCVCNGSNCGAGERCQPAGNCG
jgi:hypothetical protein